MNAWGGKAAHVRIGLQYRLHHKEFIRTPTSDSDKLLEDIAQYTVPIRPGRQDQRDLRVKGFPGFVYRVAAWKNEGEGVSTSAPSTHLFLKIPVFSGQNKAFQKKKCRANLTGHEKCRDS